MLNKTTIKDELKKLGLLIFIVIGIRAFGEHPAGFIVGIIAIIQLIITIELSYDNSSN